MLADAPFVLLDDARANGGAARLYTRPLATIVARGRADVRPALEQLRHAVAGGAHAAGFLSYGAGYALEPGVYGIGNGETAPLLWFGLFDDVDLLDPAALAALLPDPAGAWLGNPRPRIDEAAYCAAFDRVAAYIAAGDIYQANLSYRADVPFAGHPLALYAQLRASQAGWGGVAFTGEDWLLSASPELFFTLTDRQIEARPMKGTAPRGATPALDAAAAAMLAASTKDRAENLMIVDLLRNDIARVAEAGSVHVPALFTVETYPTLHTLTSTIAATLAPDCDAIDAIAALFPCGSITGAPKIRAQQIIAEVEADSRGAYTGSLGWLAPDGDAAFNVLIRTLSLDDTLARAGQGTAEIGLGGAIVADSTAEAEWAETCAKAAFVTHGATDFTLIETLRFDPVGGMPDLHRHLARLARSATALDFGLPSDLADRIDDAVGAAGEARRVRLELHRDGTVALTIAPAPVTATDRVDVALASLPVDPRDFRLRHKTSDRAFYDAARAASCAFEVVFIDPDGRVTEGSFTNLFVERDGMLLTPPLAQGLLPGILRERLIEHGRAVETPLTPDDLAGGFLLGNALRGLIPARLVRSA